MKAVLDAISTMPGVAAVYREEELGNGTTPIAQTRKAAVLSYFAGRSGDLYVLQKPYWLLDSSLEASKRATGTSHGTPYNYDQHVPVLFMGFGIQPGEYFDPVTPADIAPTLAALTGVTLATLFTWAALVSFLPGSADHVRAGGESRVGEAEARRRRPHGMPW